MNQIFLIWKSKYVKMKKGVYHVEKLQRFFEPSDNFEKNDKIIFLIPCEDCNSIEQLIRKSFDLRFVKINDG